MNNNQEDSKTKVTPKHEMKAYNINPTTGLFELVDDFIHYASKQLLLSLIITVFIYSSAFAQQNRWSYVGADVNGTRFFIDRKSIELIGSKLRMWNKSIYSDDSYRISLVEWICDDKKYFILDETIYAPNGTFAGTDKGTKWIFVTPDSISEGLYKATCVSSTKTNNTKSANKKKAQVIVKTANVRAEPDINSNVIRKVKSSESFALTDETPTDGWYQIIISGKNKTGWIHGNTIKLVEITTKKKTKKRKQ